MKKISLLIVVSLLLLAPLAAQSVEVVSPNGGESWVLNSTQTIVWKSTKPGNVKVDIVLRNSGGKVGLIKSQVSLAAGSWSWLSVGKLEDGTVVAPGTDYIVRIRDAGNTFGDDSNAAFTISGAQPPGGPASITVTSPNGGESWVKGGSRNITWNAVNFAGFVDLILKKLNEQSQKYETIGFIAKKVPATHGARSWTVGMLLSDGKTADTGGGYKVQVAKNYDGLLRPQGAPMLADESENSFSISFSASSAPIPLSMQLSVSAPAEGSEFDYSSFIINGQRAVNVPVRWTSESAGPFEFFLREAGKTAETTLKPVKAPVGVGNKTYEAEFNLTNKNTSPGLWYMIRVKSARAGGVSGKFKLKYRLWDVTLEPAFYDRHHFVKKEYYDVDGKLFRDGAFGQIDPSMAGSARVGFRNYFKQGELTDYLYHGYLYRSRVVFDFSQFKNKKGEFKQAKVVITRSKYQGSSQMDPADCCAQVYILAEPWPGSDWLAIPGTILQNYPTGNPTNFDIPDWAAAWTNGSSPNHGMLVVGTMQSMNHDNLYCVTYYKIRLKVQFQEKD